MKEVQTEHWSLQIGQEWFAIQDDETIVVSDEDEISSIELTTVQAEDLSVEQLLKELMPKENFKTTLSETVAWYSESEEDGLFWREWLCPQKNYVLIISHGCEVENKGMDDSAIDEILSTLAFAIED